MIRFERENRQYQEMLDAAIRRIQHIDLIAAAERSGLAYDRLAQSIAFMSFGERVKLDAVSLLSDLPIGMWQHLAILQYIESMDGSVPTDVWISMADLQEGGLARGASFDREIDALIAHRLGIHQPEAIRAACERLGGIPQNDSHADLCTDFYFMPRFPLRLNLWFADDEFLASGKVLVNDGVKHCLGTEAIGTVGTLLIQKVCDEAYKQAQRCLHY